MRRDDLTLLREAIRYARSAGFRRLHDKRQPSKTRALTWRSYGAEVLFVFPAEAEERAHLSVWLVPGPKRSLVPILSARVARVAVALDILAAVGMLDSATTPARRHGYRDGLAAAAREIADAAEYADLSGIFPADPRLDGMLADARTYWTTILRGGDAQRILVAELEDIVLPADPFEARETALRVAEAVAVALGEVKR